MKKTKVICIEDRYELTFAIFVRNNNPHKGRIYHQPTLSSKRRLARVIINWHKEQKIQVTGFDDNPYVFRYEVRGES